MKIIVEYWNGQGWSFHNEVATLAEGQQSLDQLRTGASAGARLIIVLAEHK